MNFKTLIIVFNLAVYCFFFYYLATNSLFLVLIILKKKKKIVLRFVGTQLNYV